MGWACAPTVIYNAFRLQKRAKKCHKDDVKDAPTESLSRSLSTDDSGSENNSSVFAQDEDMQYRPPGPPGPPGAPQAMEHVEYRTRTCVVPPPCPCPCGCPGTLPHDERDRQQLRIKTKEVIDVADNRVMERRLGVETLVYHGQTHCVNEIALVWKKDCRTWLWKSSKNS